MRVMLLVAVEKSLCNVEVSKVNHCYVKTCWIMEKKVVRFITTHNDKEKLLWTHKENEGKWQQQDY